MNDNFDVILKVSNITEEVRIILEESFKALIINIKNGLELETNTLDRVILTENYVNELQLLEKEGMDKNLLTYTDNGLGVGIGKCITFNEKDILILGETFLRLFFDDDKRQTANNILAHELSHIDDRNKKKEYIKDFFSDEYFNYEDKIYYPLIKSSWNEFYANYKSSVLLTQTNIEWSHDTFFRALNSFNDNIFVKKWNYQNGLISLEEFLDSFNQHAFYLFSQASYFLGNVLGMNYSLNKYLYDNKLNIKGTIMEETLYSMENIFSSLIKKYPNKWNGVHELENLKNCLIDYYKDIGVIFEKDFTHVLFTKYGYQIPVNNINI